MRYLYFSLLFLLTACGGGHHSGYIDGLNMNKPPADVQTCQAFQGNYMPYGALLYDKGNRPSLSGNDLAGLLMVAEILPQDVAAAVDVDSPVVIQGQEDKGVSLIFHLRDDRFHRINLSSMEAVFSPDAGYYGELADRYCASGRWLYQWRYVASMAGEVFYTGHRAIVFFPEEGAIKVSVSIFDDTESGLFMVIPHHKSSMKETAIRLQAVQL